VLIAEFQGRRVPERDFKGEIRWEQTVQGNPIGVQRLANGNTFVVMQNRLEEYNRDKTKVWEYSANNGSIFRARKTANGEVVFVTNDGVLSRLDPNNRTILGAFNVGRVPTLFGNIDVLPNGNVLVPLYSDNRVIEYDRNGKQIKQFNTPNPSSASRLPNGHTLVASQSSRQIIEFDREGRQRWAHNADGMVFNARAR
jgi:outer membrane protein assembly factor BamB